MKPKTKLQVRVVLLSETKLPEITQEQKDYAFKHCLDHEAVRLKNGKVTCLDCAHSWQSIFQEGWHDEILKNNCPSCGTKLKIKQTRKKNFHDFSYLGIVTTCEEYQVIRLIKINANYKSGNKVDLRIYPVSEIWMAPNGKYEIIGFNHRNSYYESGWWTGDWSLKSRDHLRSHCLNPYKMWPIKKVTSKIKRNGFKNSFHGIAPYVFIRNILDYSECETLLKAKQYSLLKTALVDYRGTDLKKRWKSIKIAMRNNYIVKDAQIWYDYLKFVEYFKGDILSPKIVCPKDLKAEHNRLMHEKQAIENIEREIRDSENIAYQKQIKKNKKAHFKNTSKLFSQLNITKNKISIVGFTSEEQVKEEGLILDHCIYTNSYHLNLNKVLFSARVKDKVTETIEFCLIDYKVLACRGYDNESSKYHNQIISLINDNLHIIKRIMNPPKKRKTKKLKTAA
jgi:ssDNA-binding Zn-finger/Zn-ribbon topoisomerase 1